jgi:hypothetical protein
MNNQEVQMKKAILILSIIPALLLVVSCEDNTVYVRAPEAPATPQGLTSITGDEFIELLWYPVDMDGMDSYNIYWAPGNANPRDPDEYQYLVSVSATRTSWTDFDVENGVTYYYTITAVNVDGDESYMSNYVMDTPRPSGYDVRIYDYHRQTTRDSSGYDLYYQEKIDYADVNCDFYLDYDTIVDEFYITVRHDDYYIQDFGYAIDFDDVGYAPPDGWSAFAYVEAVVGHIYMLKLRHFNEWHYAKIWLTELDRNNLSMEFSWAYQIDPDNRELSIGPQVKKPKSENDQIN